MSTYSLNTSGNARHTFINGRGAGINATSNLTNFLLGSAGLIAVKGNNTVNAAGATAATGEIEILTKTATGVETYGVDVGSITARKEITIANLAAQTAQVISASVGDITDPEEFYVLRLFDLTEGNEPSHIEEYRTHGTGAVYTLLAADYNRKLNAYNNEGYGVKPRYTVSSPSSNLSILPLDARTNTRITLTRHRADGTVTNVQYILKSAVAQADNTISLEAANQLYYEGNQFTGGYNDAGWMRDRYEDIGDGGAAPQVGDTILIVDFSKGGYATTVPNPVENYKGTFMILMRNADAIAAVKKILGYA